MQIQMCRVFVVGNPCNTNCYIAMKNAKGVSSDPFFAMTMLDETERRQDLQGKQIRMFRMLKMWPCGEIILLHNIQIFIMPLSIIKKVRM